MRRAVILLALTLGAGVCLAGEKAAPPAAEAPKAAAEAPVVRCPVTGEVVPRPAEAPVSEYRGLKYYFCCPPCKADFDKDPETYLKGKKP